MSKEINISDKEFTSAEQKAISYLQDREYSKAGDAVTAAGAKIGEFFRKKKSDNSGSRVGNRFASFKKAFNISKNRKAEGFVKTQSAAHTVRDQAMKATGFDRKAERAKVLDKIKAGNMHRIVGGTAAGTVVGGAVGAGIGHLATSKSRKRISFLETKGNNLSNKEREELVTLKAKVKKAKVIGGAVGAVAGGAGGYFGGKHLADKNKGKLKSAYKKVLRKRADEADRN